MTKSASTRALIEEFVDLAMLRRRRAVPAEVKARMEDLEDWLRDSIDGARPGPKKIANPGAAPTNRPPNVTPAVVDVHPTTEPSPPLDRSGPADAKRRQAASSSQPDAKRRQAAYSQPANSQLDDSQQPAYSQPDAKRRQAASSQPASSQPASSQPDAERRQAASSQPDAKRRQAASSQPDAKRRQAAYSQPASSQTVELTAADEAKTNSVAVNQRPPSRYTPSKVPAYLEDYYAESIMPARIEPTEVPSRIVAADGSAPDISVQARSLLGIGVLKPQPRLRSAMTPSQDLPQETTTEDLVGPSTTNDLPIPEPAAASRPLPKTPAISGPHASVYLLDGTSTRGMIPEFDPDSGVVEVHVDGRPVPYELEEVMVLLFRVEPGRPPTPIEGDPVLVRLVNDREISGVTPDYREGAMALTVVPSPRQRNIDRVWIPAWAVKAIEMDDGAD